MRIVLLFVLLAPQASLARQQVPESAETYTKSGDAWQDKGELDKAIEDYNKAIRLDPDYSSAYNNRGTAWLRLGEFEKSILDYTEVIRITPDFALAFNNRGLVLEATGDYEKAIKDYSDAIRLKPDYAKALEKLCWLLATCPNRDLRDGKKAVEYGEKACELTNWAADWTIARLSAAYAETGDFDKAIATLEKAIDMNPEFDLGTRENMLERFRNGEPFHQRNPDPPMTDQESTRSDETNKSQIEPRKLFDGETMDGWEIVGFGGQDNIEVVEGAIVAEAGYPLAGIASTLKDLPKSGYTLALEAQKIDGTDFFCCVTFPVKEQHCSLVLGGWGGTLCGISCINKEDASQNSTKWLKKFERGQWYAIEIKVTDDRIVCSVDDEVTVDLPLDGVELSLRSEVTPTTPIGICAFETKSAWRNIRLTPHDSNSDSEKQTEPIR